MPTDHSRLANLDPVERVKKTTALIKQLQDEVTELSEIRRQAILEVQRREGIATQSALAHRVGLNRGLISQLLTPKASAERSFFTRGTTPLTLILGPSARDTDGAETTLEQDLTALAQELGVECEVEFISDSGHVDLNRPNLLVACGPGRSAAIAAVLDSDASLRFMHDDAGWYLQDVKTEKPYRSPQDSPTFENADFGYLGRVRRLDGKGTFLCVAGIHSTGTRGAAQYLIDNKKTLQSDFRRARFSMLIRTEHDKTTKKITKIEPVAGIGLRPAGPVEETS